ncbi:efflux RND transporter periplasmic adaptor subunit [Chloroflexota bacterium]
MRLLKVMLILLVLGGVSVLSSSCASDSEPVPEGQEITVQRGDLRIDITGVGNLALSRTEDLAFDLFYQDGTVEEILVEEADSVEEGQVLAKLVISEWEDQLTVLEDKVIAAERNVTAKERALTAAQRKVIDAERQVIEAERGVIDAEHQVTAEELDLLQAQINLNNAELALEEIEEESTDRQEIEVKELQLEIAEQRLVDAQIALEEAANEGVADARLELEDAKLDLEDAQLAVEDAQVALEDAKKTLADAKQDLDEAKNDSPEVKAPFTGFITKVNVSGGEEIKKGTVAVTLADPSKFEADIMVSEMDILQVKLGGEAEVSVDAIPGMSLPAEVTHISPTATISQGVVNYKVKVAIQSLEAVMQERQASRQEAIQNIQQGELPERIKQAIEEGRMTQEQAEAMMQQRQQGQGGQSRQGSAAIPEDFQLREGLTITVSIIVDERNNALLVPNSAITTQGRQTFVQVPAADGTPEQRMIQTGISDYQFTEVIEGLSEGEQIIVPEGTTSSTPTPQGQPSSGIPREMRRLMR